MGSMGSLGLPSMALLKAKPGLFYRNSGLKTKVPFAALKSTGKHLHASIFPISPGHSSPSCRIHTQQVPCAHCMQWDALRAGQPQTRAHRRCPG